MSFADLPPPDFTGVRIVEPALQTLREMIDWQFLFLAWELKGKYPAILEQPVARELFDDANTLLDEIIADGSFTAEGVYGFWPAHSEGDDIVLDGLDRSFPMLRQRMGRFVVSLTASATESVQEKHGSSGWIRPIAIVLLDEPGAVSVGSRRVHRGDVTLRRPETS